MRLSERSAMNALASVSSILKERDSDNEIDLREILHKASNQAIDDMFINRRGIFKNIAMWHAVH